MMGKDRLSALFTSSVWKNERSKGGSSSDSIVDDLIAEITVDESDREARRRRRGLPPAQLSHVSASQPIPPPNGSFQAELPLPQIHEDRATVTEPPVPIFQDEDGGVDMDLLENGHFASVENGNVKMEEEKVTDQKVEVRSNGTVPASIKEVKQELAVPKPEKEVCLNAKIGTNDNLISATDGWKAIREGDKSADVSEVMTIQVNDEKTEFILDSDGSFPFYMIDAYEEPFGANAGIVYLFGKVKSKVGNAYHSCCVIVKNMQRCVYAIPNSSVFQNNKMTELETELANSKITASEFHAKLQEMASELKTEIAEKLLDLNVSNFSMMPVKRNYAFERSDIPTGEQYVLKINYPFKDRALSADLKGDSFHALLGVNSSALELFLIKRKIKGPSWLSISKFSNPQQRVSWCKIEVIVDSSKDIHVSTLKMVLEIPPLLVASLNLKTKINEKHSTNEIVSASVICCNKAKIDGPMIASEWERPGVLSHFTVIRKLEGGIFPVGFNKDVDDRNLKAGLTVLALESSERALLNRLMIELHKLDVDVLVGHNISGFDLDVLLHRSQACKVPSSMWSKIGRLKRSVMPKLTKGSTRYGSGASPGLMSCIAGRLLCDTYVCSKDLLKEVSYSLTQLAKTQLNKDRKEVNPHDIPSMFQASQSLLELVEYGETDAWLSMALMFRLSILPLTRQLTNISGNSWGKTLQGARAQRVEYLLLHAFHAKKYIVPDKNLGKLKDSDATKRKLNTDMKGDAEEIIDGDVTLDNDMQHAEQGKSRKGPAYAGGLVLEPKKGLYEKIVLLLDFNSLYPSIIQEYNICFTTVERTGASSTLPSSRTMGVLPELLKNLVERRRMVKSWLKSASGLKVQQLDIQQQALKLTANSMYGCLGFSSSRFYAKPIAELITSQGREILQSTVDLVQNVLNLEVIYGDTDSIMIYSGLDDIANAKEMAGKVIREVNKKYRCLEIDLDGLYKRMLLLKKKKYAAVKIHIKDGKPCEIIERRGLDIVRRDWSILSKELGDFCLSQILSGGSCEDVVEIIHSTLMKKQEEMRNGEIELEKYIITKSLTKPPEEYPDGRNQPHVQVAMRLKQSGYTSGFSPGDTVPYIICCEPGAHSSAGIADRARHPDELKRDSGNWMIDIDYYLSQQIHPVVSRLCASIQGTSPARLADCLGLDSSKFQRKFSEPTSRDPSSVLVSVLDDDNRYDGCEPLRLTCPSCSSSFECPPVSSLVQNLLNGIAPESDGNKNPESHFWQKIRCSRCPEDMDASRISSAIIANQVKRQAEHFLSIYYKGLMTCDDELCKYTTRIVNLRVIGDSERGTVCPNYPRCNGHLVRQFAEPDLYKQLSYFCHIFDTKQCLEKLDKDARLHIEKELSRIVPVIDSASATIQKIRDQCSYGWVQLQDLIILA